MGKRKPPQRIGRSKKEQRLRDQMTKEFSHFLSDIEMRVAQAYDVARRQGDIARLYAEDLVSTNHQITGYTLTPNTPAGQFTWASVRIVYNGVTYTTVDGASTGSNTYVHFVKPGSGTGPVTLIQGTTKPTLSPGDCLVFTRNMATPGVGISVLESTIPTVLADGAVDTGAIQDSAVNANKILDGAITNTEINASANIVGSKLSPTAGIVGTQLHATAGITGGQISGTAGLTGGQIADNAITNLKIADGAVSPVELTLFQHLIL